MTDKLPHNLLSLFAPRPPLRWSEPFDHAPQSRQTPNIGGIGQYMQALKEYKDNDGYVPTDSWLQKRDRRKMEKQQKQEQLVDKAAKECTASINASFDLHCATLFQPYKR
jgi:U1 small nuclear ribonucleoprotein